MTRLRMSTVLSKLKMIRHTDISKRQLLTSLRARSLKYAGNSQLKIYGTLNCSSGKGMKKENRVFFRTEMEAIECGFRPCAHCMREHYLKWKLTAILFFCCLSSF
jgi:methylphosphotriester-DNA--protein-cysteine methyltransferase